MEASARPGSGPWYHGSAHEYEDGHVIDPAQPHDAVHQGISEPDHAYITSDPYRALGWASIAANAPAGQDGGHVYQVHPLGPHEEDEMHDDSRKTRHPLRVVRRWSMEHTAAARPPRGHATCQCCHGDGSHADGSECTSCQGLGHRPQTEIEHCPGQPSPRRRHWRQPHAAWSPDRGIFGPTTGMDSRLFDEHGELRPAVRGAIMEKLDQALRVDGGLTGSDWQLWTRVYLAGGSASEWAGDRPNETAQDLDILIGVDFAQARGNQSGSDPWQHYSDDQIVTAMNATLRAQFNEPGWEAPFGGYWDVTGYVNPRAWAIEVLKPYAAYDLTDMRWAVRPPHLPGHSAADFDKGVLSEARAITSWARAILRIADPAVQHREALGLWEFIHRARDRAFSSEGDGWQDPGNLVEKWLAYSKGGLLDKIRELAYAGKTARLNTRILDSIVAMGATDSALPRAESQSLLARNRITLHPHGPLTEGVDATPDLEHTVEVPAHLQLHTEQADLNHAALAHYRSHGTSTCWPGAMQSDHNDETPGVPHRPTVVSYRGKHWLTDGHHRAIVSRESGEPSFTAWHVDPERDRREYEEWAAGRQRTAAGSDGDRTVTCSKGHEHWGAHGAAGLLLRHRDESGVRYLLQKRSAGVDHGGRWSIPSGARGKDESPEQGAEREFREEMGRLPIGSKHSHTVKSTDCGDWAFHTAVYDAPSTKLPRGHGETEDEVHGSGWFTPHEIKGLPLHPAFEKSWDTVRRSKGPVTASATRPLQPVSRADFAHETHPGDDMDAFRVHDGKYLLHHSGYNRVNAYRIGQHGLVHPDAPNYSGSLPKPRGAGYLSWLSPRGQGDSGEIYKTYVSSQHRRKGLASAMLGFARERASYPIRHSTALSDDGQEFAAAEGRTAVVMDSDGVSEWLDGPTEVESDEPSSNTKAASVGSSETSYYYGTTHEHQLGDEIHHHYWAKYPDHDRDNSPLYTTTDPSLAGHIADLRERQGHGQKPGRMYQVSPTGPLRPDEVANPSIKGASSWQTGHPLRVEREIPRHEWPSDLLAWQEPHNRHEAAEERRFHYHVSPSHNRESIQQDGLDKNKSGLGPRVYLSDDAGVRRGKDSGYDVWKVDTTGIPLRDDKIDGEGAYYAQRSIHPSRLTLHRAGESREQMHYHAAGNSVVIELDVPQGLIHNVDKSVEYGTHVTVVYLGKGLDEGSFAEVLRRAEDAARRQPGPLTGTLSGLGTFPPSKSSDGKVPAYIPVNVPGIHVLQNRLKDLSVSEHKEYVPHVTLAYCDPGEELPPPHHEVPITFTHLTVRRGKHEAHRFPFGGTEDE